MISRSLYQPLSHCDLPVLDAVSGYLVRRRRFGVAGQHEGSPTWGLTEPHVGSKALQASRQFLHTGLRNWSTGEVVVSHIPCAISPRAQSSNLSNPPSCLTPIQRRRSHRIISTRVCSTCTRMCDVVESIAWSTSVACGRKRMAETRDWSEYTY